VISDYVIFIIVISWKEVDHDIYEEATIDKVLCHRGEQNGVSLEGHRVGGHKASDN
jgi:hypothetical protein